MKSSEIYHVKSYDLFGLSGISDQTLQLHFGLYEGYVKAANGLRAQLDEYMRDGKLDQEEMPAYSELTRRLGFEYNGMVLHEYYFGNLRPGGADHPNDRSAFGQAVQQGFGSFERWKTDFCGVGMLRGVGWAICNVDPSSGRVSNHWISLHEHGNVAGFMPLLVMDVWEHAFLLDYKPSERKQYIEAFFSNIDWNIVEGRLQAGVSAGTVRR
ncbi:MAG: sod [Nitrospira sp.]|jgi:Fe-Mn family superoxide dismutase|nr:sod [Nitrospira sp.]